MYFTMENSGVPRLECGRDVFLPRRYFLMLLDIVLRVKTKVGMKWDLCNRFENLYLLWEEKLYAHNNIRLESRYKMCFYLKDNPP